MKTLSLSLLLLISLCARASETNIFFPLLKAGDRTFTNARVTSITATHAIVWHAGGGSRVALTNFAPEIQKRFDYDPDLAARVNATAAANAAAHAENEYIRAARAAVERNYKADLARARAAYEYKFRLSEAKAKAALEKLKRAEGNLQDAKADREAAWDRYIFTDPEVMHKSVGSGGRRIVNEDTRRADARASDQDVRQAAAAIPALREAAAAAVKAHNEEARKLKSEYLAAVLAIDNHYATLRAQTEAALAARQTAPKNNSQKIKKSVDTNREM